MKNILAKIKLYIIEHKILSAVVFIVILYGGYWGYGKLISTAGDTRYVMAKVERGAIVVSISGTGQVSNINQIDLKSKVSGDVVYLGAQNGDKVNAGMLIMKIDPKDAQKSVRDAEISLESAKLSLEKLKIQNSNENLNASSLKAYNDGFNAVSDAFSDLNEALTELDDILGQNNLSEDAARSSGKTTKGYREKAVTAYYNAKTAYNTSKKNYSALNINSSKEDIENIVTKTYETTRLLSDAIKNTATFVDFMANRSSNPSAFSSSQSALATYTNTVNGHLSNLLSSKTNIENNKDSFQNSALDIQSSELSVRQKENTLQDAKDKLADYFVRTPYAGTITNLDIKKSDSVSTGTVVGTLIAEKQLALISLNEVDVAKIKIGQKATLTFDAVPDLAISGIVTEIDSIGTVDQGVVTYDVKINFDTEDNRVKPEMSVSATIAIDMKQDILTVPNSAVKSQKGKSYVEMFDSTLAPISGSVGSISEVSPIEIPVEVGISNDSRIEIISGLKEGDEIITRTILPTTGASSSTPSIFGSPAGGNRGTRTN